MKAIGMMKALRLIQKAGKMVADARAALQQKRLSELVCHAKDNSPYFSALYKNIGENFSLTDLPVTNKVELMANFDTWVTDSAVKLADINKFMENIDNVGRKINDKYLVYTTSGSTGNPAVVLYNSTVMNVASAIGILRSYARPSDMKSFIKRGGRSMGLFSDRGFYLGCGSIKYNLRKMPWKKRQMGVCDVGQPTAHIVKVLNDFQPVMLGGYPTVLELLIAEAREERLHISPTIIMTGGEYLSDALRLQLAQVFKCYVQTNYSCTEGGTMACECTERHFHVNDDWVILEAIDENNCPVSYGTKSAKLLLTNLSNFVQPFIRYEITDRIVLHDEPCACGKSSPWLEIEGRTDDILEFTNHVRIAPLALYSALKEVHEMSRFQLVQHGESKLELRLVSDNNDFAFEKAKSALQHFLAERGISVEIYLSDTAPQAHPLSGKFQHIIKSS